MGTHLSRARSVVDSAVLVASRRITNPGIWPVSTCIREHHILIAISQPISSLHHSTITPVYMMMLKSSRSTYEVIPWGLPPQQCRQSAEKPPPKATSLQDEANGLTTHSCSSLYKRNPILAFGERLSPVTHQLKYQLNKTTVNGENSQATGRQRS